MKLLKKLSLGALAALVTFVAVAQSPTIFNLIRVNTSADIRGIIENQTGVVTVDDDAEFTQDVEVVGTLTANSVTVASGALTRVDDTNVTLTLGGSPSTALLNATSLTLGWSGQLAVGRGGTGASTLTGLLLGNGTSAFTALTATDDSVVVGNGTTYQVKAVPDCDDTGGNHLNYDTGTNAFACGNTGGGTPTPGGSDTEVQYNNAGALGGDTGFTFNNSTDSIVLAGEVQGADLEATDDLVVGDDAAITGDLTVSTINITPSTGTFTMTFDVACTTSPTMQLRYNKIGNMVIITGDSSGDAFNCTSDSTGFSDSGTPVPAAIRPTTATVEIPVHAIDNGVYTAAVLLIGPTGGVQINNCTTYGGAGNPCVAGWTNSGVKALNNISGAYNINN